MSDQPGIIDHLLADAYTTERRLTGDTTMTIRELINQLEAEAADTGDDTPVHIVTDYVGGHHYPIASVEADETGIDLLPDFT